MNTAVGKSLPPPSLEPEDLKQVLGWTKQHINRIRRELRTAGPFAASSSAALLQSSEELEFYEALGKLLMESKGFARFNEVFEKSKKRKDAFRYRLDIRALDWAIDRLEKKAVPSSEYSKVLPETYPTEESDPFIQFIVNHGLGDHAGFILWCGRQNEREYAETLVGDVMSSFTDEFQRSEFLTEIRKVIVDAFDDQASINEPVLALCKRWIQEATTNLSQIDPDDGAENLKEFYDDVAHLIFAREAIACSTRFVTPPETLVSLIEELKSNDDFGGYVEALGGQTELAITRELREKIGTAIREVSEQLDEQRTLTEELGKIQGEIQENARTQDFGNLGALGESAKNKQESLQALLESLKKGLYGLCENFGTPPPTKEKGDSKDAPESEGAPGAEIGETGANETTREEGGQKEAQEHTEVDPDENQSTNADQIEEKNLESKLSPDPESEIDNEDAEATRSEVSQEEQPPSADPEPPAVEAFQKKSVEDRVTESLGRKNWGRAYWLSWAQNALGCETWNHQIVKAFTLGGLTTAGIKLNADYLDAINHIDPTVAEKDRAHKLLTISALLPAALFSSVKPHCIYQFQAILKTNIGEVDELFDHVFRYTMHQGLVATTGDGVTPDTEIKSELDSFAQEARDILESRTKRSINYAPAERVAQALFGKRGELWQVLDIISRQSEKQSHRVDTFLTNNPLDLLSRSGDIGGVSLAARKKFAGPARNQLNRSINETHGLADRWLKLAKTKQPEISNAPQDEGQQLTFQHELQSRFNRLQKDGAKVTLDKIEQAAMDAVLIATERLVDYITVGRFEPEAFVYTELIRLANIELDSTLHPLDEAAESLYEAMTGPEEIEIDRKQLGNELLVRHEFARARKLVDDGVLPDEFFLSIEQRLGDARRKFDESLLLIEGQIEDAFLVGALDISINRDIAEDGAEKNTSGSSDNSRTQMLAKVERIRETLERLDEQPSTREINDDLKQLENEVEEIENQNRNLLENAAKDLLDKWTGEHRNPEDIEYFSQEYENSLEKRDLVAAWDVVSQAQQLAPGERLPQQNGLQARTLRLFEDELTALYEVVAADQKAIKTIRDHIVTATADYKDAEYIRNDGVDLAERALKAANSLIREPDSEAQLKTLFQCLGLSLKLLKKKKSPGVAHFYGEPKARFNCPIPEFGSAIQHGVDLVVVAKRSQPAHILSAVRDLGLEPSKSVFVVYPWPLSLQERLELRGVALASNAHLSPLIVDACAILFSCAASEVLNTFFNITLPFVKANPFIQAGGNVPVEMFVGREAEAQDLLDDGGSCIVYGGRQLGKSALLRYLTNEYNLADGKRHVVYSDIQGLSTAQYNDQYGEIVCEFWCRLADQLESNGFCTFHKGTGWAKNRPDQIAADVIQKIQETLKRKRSWKLLVLLDEADNLLEADAKKDFRLVKEIRSLMEGTSRRFKCVFTGLHNVQQYYGWTNHPFAQLGRDICIRPLPQAAAFRLVVDRMKSLGYEFDDRASVLRILSQVNYHPGLIQIFCHKLVENIQRKRPDVEFVRRVGLRHVREVENDREVMDHIRNRFDWTLSLDDRYKVLTYAFILEGNPRVALSLKQFQDLGRSQWNSVFGAMDLRAMRGLLEEMVGLGVFANLGDEYLLKSPNLLRLIGHGDEIREQLNTIVSRTQLERTQPKNFRSILSSKERRFGPLTQGQTSALFGEDLAFSVTLIIGNALNGLEEVRTQLDSIAESQSESSLRPIVWSKKTLRPEESATTALLGQGLSRAFGRTPSGGGSYSVIDILPNADGESVQQQIADLAGELAPRFKNNKKGRLFILVGPSDALRWLSSGGDVAVPPTVSVHFLQQWTKDAVLVAFEQLKITPTQPDIDQMLDETSGHHSLVQEFFQALPDEGVALNKKIVDQALSGLQEKREAGAAENFDRAGVTALPTSACHAMAETIEALVDEPSRNQPAILESGFLSLVISESDDDDALVDEHVFEEWLQNMGHCAPTEDNEKLSMSKWVRKLYLDLADSTATAIG